MCSGGGRNHAQRSRPLTCLRVESRETPWDREALSNGGKETLSAIPRGERQFMKLGTRIGRRCSWPWCAPGAFAFLLAGCGSGTAGLLANNGGSGGSSPTLSACTVQSPKASPATIELTAAAQPVHAPGGTVPLPARSRPMHLSNGVSGNPVSLPASRADDDVTRTRVAGRWASAPSSPGRAPPRWRDPYPRLTSIGNDRCSRKSWSRRRNPPATSRSACA